MNQAIKKKWIDALLSGEYKQGKKNLYLAKTQSFCCLGVLGHVKGVRLENMQGQDYLEGRTGKCYLLPYVTQEALASLNDSGVPFEMIAGLIDEAL